MAAWQFTADVQRPLPPAGARLQIHGLDFPIVDVAAVGEGDAGSLMIEVGELPIEDLDLTGGQGDLIVHIDAEPPGVAASVAGSDGHTSALVLLSRRASDVDGVVPGAPMLADFTDLLMTELFGSEDVFLCAVATHDASSDPEGAPTRTSPPLGREGKAPLRGLLGRRPAWPAR